MEQAKHYLTQFTGPQSYVIFYLLVTGCGIGLPMNSDFILISASVLAALHYFNLSILATLAFLALLSGDAINYFVARRYGKQILRNRPLCWILNPIKVSHAEKYMEEKGNAFIFCVRFLPLIRTVLYFTAGSLQVKPKTFFLLNALSTLVYLTLLMGASYYAGENIDALIAFFKQFQFALLGLFILTVLAVIFKKKWKRPIVS